MERLMDLIAMELDMDPSEVRRKNFIAPDAFPYETPTGLVYDSGSYEKAMDRALELSDYRDWKEKARQSVSSDGPLIGVGLATVVKLGGHGGGSEDAWIKIDSSGKITALTGVSPHGQGSATTFAQIVADELGVTPYDVEVLHGDTALVPAGGGTAATRGSVMGGSAMYLVVQKAHDKLAHIASHLMGCPAEDAVFEEGRVYDRNHPQKTMAFAEVASAAYNEELLPPDAEVGLDFEGTFLLGKANHSPHAFAAHVVVVEVDRDTGESKIVRYIAVHDCGRIINPMLFDGQVHGAIAQGIGQAMTEGMEYDQTGQPLTASLMDYAVPFAEETPAFVSDTADTPSPLNPLGIKGVGELPTVAAPPAVANAVMDALSHAGVRHVETPLTPEKVWRALHGKGQ
jgi:carbon-monoxide dehydrogenase large subunit